MINLAQDWAKSDTSEEIYFKKLGTLTTWATIIFVPVAFLYLAYHVVTAIQAGRLHG